MNFMILNRRGLSVVCCGSVVEFAFWPNNLREVSKEAF